MTRSSPGPEEVAVSREDSSGTLTSPNRKRVVGAGGCGDEGRSRRGFWERLEVWAGMWGWAEEWWEMRLRRGAGTHTRVLLTVRLRPREPQEVCEQEGQESTLSLPSCPGGQGGGSRWPPRPLSSPAPWAALATARLGLGRVWRRAGPGGKGWGRQRGRTDTGLVWPPGDQASGAALSPVSAPPGTNPGGPAQSGGGRALGNVWDTLGCYRESTQDSLLWSGGAGNC